MGPTAISLSLESILSRGGGGDPVAGHRKGATRAFGPSSPELPKPYQGVGQPVLIPGSVGTASHVLAGTDEARELSVASTSHGAGRAMSRGAARRQGTSCARSLRSR